GPSDVAVSATVREHARRAVTDLTGRTELGVLAGVLARCAVLVADDSGPLHLARAVGTATVGLYWAGNAITAAPPTRARHRPLLSWTVHCPECGTDCTPAGFPARPGEGCDHRPSFLDQIPVAEVVAETLDLLHAAWTSPVRVPAPAWTPR
ncbi:MAG TPA: glycosyltransferase family 9 protein, partial [Pseudonocardia sp.]|nr:glycosyltransferase family 9 protein [Pseudonocardia sp.]